MFLIRNASIQDDLNSPITMPIFFLFGRLALNDWRDTALLHLTWEGPNEQFGLVSTIAAAIALVAGTIAAIPPG